MVHKQANNYFLIGLILLLGVQLTGLSCLGEWRSLPPHASPAFSSQLPAGTVNVDQPGDDGCPCHLAFMSVPKSSSESCCLISLLSIGVPATLVPGHISLPFHPPLSL
jgi:hypothetical protein